MLPENLGNRLGLLGGTFDPVHNGHLAVAAAVQAALGLDSVLFLPAALPPHKQGGIITPLATRLAMLELAIAARPGFAASDLEGARRGPSYTIDTLQALRGALGWTVKLFFIIGIDAFAEIATWKQYRQLPAFASLAVIAERPDSQADVGRIVGLHYPGFTREGDALVWKSGNAPGRIHAVTMPPVAASSTEIRRRIREGLPIDALTPAAVARYIHAHRLYAVDKAPSPIAS